jgi:maleate cis-trans isomerase
MNREPVAVGLMVPSNNTTMEPELLAWLPEGSSCRTLRIPRAQGMLSPADMPAYVECALSLATEFSDEDIDLVVYGCTAAGFMGGPARDAELAAELARITGKRVVTTAGAMIAALEHIEAHRIAVITPYLDLVNERIRAFLAHSGISVEILSTFNARTVEELAAIQPRQIADRARDVMQSGIDALFIACSQLPTRAIIDDLERELGIPVWSSIRATAWQALRATERALA